ncbi:MAG: HD domain-containing protein [Lachnospiraceae bacterium]
MDIMMLLEFMKLAEHLKCNTRHSWTSSGRAESVAEHTFGLQMLAWLMKDEFPELDMNKVMEMCLFHDMGEAITGDIPAFDKEEEDDKLEAEAWDKIVSMLPPAQGKQVAALFAEIEKNQTKEAKLFQALDKIEAVIQHNIASIESWLPLEYELNQIYGEEEAANYEYTLRLRKILKDITIEKIAYEGSHKI